MKTDYEKENLLPVILYYANELRDHRQFRAAIQFYQKFIDMEQGWVEDKIRHYKFGCLL